MARERVDTSKMHDVWDEGEESAPSSDNVDLDMLDAEELKAHRHAVAVAGMLSMMATPKVEPELKKQPMRQPHEFLDREAMLEKLRRFG